MRAAQHDAVVVAVAAAVVALAMARTARVAAGAMRVPYLVGAVLASGATVAAVTAARWHPALWAAVVTLSGAAATPPAAAHVYWTARRRVPDLQDLQL